MTRVLRDWLPVLVVFAAGMLLWQFALAPWLGQFLLPTPAQIVKSLHTHWSVLWHAGWFTLEEALGGFAIGCGLGIVAALALARWRRLSGALMPYFIAANAVPIIAFAPIMNNWFGLLNPHSKMAIAAVLCFFPVLVNTTRGLTSVRPEAIELMRSYAASEVEIFRRVRIPTALPFIFTGLKVATVLSMIGAIVGEYFGGSIQALGVQIENSVTLFDLPLAWAAIVVASSMGIAFYALIGVVERFTMSWARNGVQQ
ncbi:MAG TPA: ABC transporter permease [Gaiellaceae bacterium]|nr:ABC transporter permease [Gaiellaceae bacterium]